MNETFNERYIGTIIVSTHSVYSFFIDIFIFVFILNFIYFLDFFLSLFI